MHTITVLYEDNHLLAVVKPAGVLTQGDITGDTSIFQEVKSYLKEKKNKKTPSNPSGQAGNVFLGLLHRLDRPVSGIILFAKTSKGASRLSEQFRNHTIEKIYHAVVVGKPEQKRGVLTHMLGKDEKLKKAKEYQDGKLSQLYYEVVNPVRDQKIFSKPQKSKISNGVKSNETYSLLKIKIDTGKFHQIRAQLSLAGFPIVGDVKYLPRHLPAGRQGRQVASEWNNKRAIALCATNLSFLSATENKQINLQIEIPKEWQKFI